MGISRPPFVLDNYRPTYDQIFSGL